MFQMFPWLHPWSWNQNPFRALISLVPNQCLGLFLITPDSLPNSPHRQRGIIIIIIVLGLCFSLFQLLGWGHLNTSPVLPVTSPGSFTDLGLSHLLLKAPAIIHLWASWSAPNHVLYQLGTGLYVYCSAGCLWCQYATLIPEIIWSKGPSPGDPVLGLIILYLSIISTLWWKWFELVSDPCKQTPLE